MSSMSGVGGETPGNGAGGAAGAGDPARSTGGAAPDADAAARSGGTASGPRPAAGATGTAGESGPTPGDVGPAPGDIGPRPSDTVPDEVDAVPGAAPALSARPVERRAAVIRLRPEKEAEYLALHADAWPGVLDALRRAHIGNYSIFLRDGLLFSYLEYSGSDWASDSAAIAADPVSRAWWALTDPCQQPLDTTAPGEGWAPAREVFHLA